MNIVNSQDEIEGSWDENENTKIIKEKYKKEFEKLIGLKNKKMSEKVALTILVIYYINKEHFGFLKELLLIIKKAEIFVKKETGDTYENILNEIGIN